MIYKSIQKKYPIISNAYTGTSCKVVIFIFITILFQSCNSKQSIDNTYPVKANAKVDYNFDVRPILSDKCFACHGPDKENQKAGLRLDLKKSAYARLQNGRGRAIVPGKPERSKAYQRIISLDPDQVMPPPESHLSLTESEKNTIRAWIEQGAEYKEHWAFVPPVKPELPSVSNDKWSSQPIDHFILAKLESKGLGPSQKATKETLIRRVSFDLTGLPPTLEEIESFKNDDAPDAYEKIVDKLLASKSYGERMVADWLDVARYADSDGYLDDKHRSFSPWRDWAIEAFNNNMPYDEFITQQLAGDIMPNATKESTLATAFNRLHKKNSEAGIVFEEYRVEYVADRTNTLGKGILGLSLECARCHDHKYDPISTKEYYQLSGFFNSTFEIGSPAYGPGQVPGPALLLSTKLEDEELAKIKVMILNLEEKVADKCKETEAFEQWKPSFGGHQTVLYSLEAATSAHYPFDDIDSTSKKGTYVTQNTMNAALPAKLVQPIHKEGFRGKGLYVSDYNNIILGEKIGWNDRTDEFSFSLYLKPDTLYEEVGILWHSEELRLGLKGYSLHLADNKVRFIMSRTWPQNAIQVTTRNTIEIDQWTQITVTYDGSSKAEGVNIYLNGIKQELDIDYNNLYKSILFEPDIHTYGFDGIRLGARDKFIPFKKGGLDEVKVFKRKLSELEAIANYDLDLLKQKLDNKTANTAQLHEYFNLVISEEVKEAKQSLQKAREQENQLISNIREIMVMGDLPEPRPTYVLERGMYNAHGEEVEPMTPEVLPPFESQFPKNRYGLSQWLFSKDHPLTARVYVNRIWQMYFGTGIVSTVDDFGSQGSLPSHPELLDWLAIYFMESGWDIKALHKLIVTSSTYQQSSRLTPELLEADPENRLLARGPRYRLPAEMIRDNALAVSGLLVDKQGGESVYPYQPEGLWDGLTTKHWAYKYLQEEGDGLYRRSIYTIWKRASPPPYMQIFDVDDRGDCEVMRNLSSTPLQALNLLNDPQFVEASRVLAEQVIKAEPTVDDRLERSFQMLTGRTPDQEEQELLTSFYEEELNHFQKNKTKATAFLSNGAKEWDRSQNPAEIAALGVVVNAIMNTTESYTKK